MHTPVRSRFVAILLLVGLSVFLAACGSSEGPGGASPDAPPVTRPSSSGDDGLAEQQPADGTGDDVPADDVPAEPASADRAADGSAGDQPADAAPVSTPMPTPAPDEAGPTPSHPVDGNCSAAGAEIEPVEVADLPAEVAALRDLLLDAALRCDEQLLHTAREESEQFTYSFGASGDAIGAWWDLEAAGASPYLRMAQVLGTTPALVDGGGIYVWPQVATGRPETTTPDAWDELVWLDDPASEADSAGGYLDWRLGISTDGQWRFFVAGD